MLCYLILLLHYISEGDVAIYTDSYNYCADLDFTYKSYVCNFIFTVRYASLGCAEFKI